jgi:hypothetical protein
MSRNTKDTLSCYWYLLCILACMYMCHVTIQSMKSIQGVVQVDQEGIKSKIVTECLPIQFDMASKQLTLLNWINDSV